MLYPCRYRKRAVRMVQRKKQSKIVPYADVRSRSRASHDTLYGRPSICENEKIKRKRQARPPWRRRSKCKASHHAKPRLYGKACQFRSGFSSAVTQKTTLTEKKAVAVKKPQSDGSMTAENSDTPRTDERCRTKKRQKRFAPALIVQDNIILSCSIQHSILKDISQLIIIPHFLYAVRASMLLFSIR